MPPSQIPELSVVIVVVSDFKHLEGCLTALSHQESAPGMEIIVPYDGCDDNITFLGSRFPNVQFYPVFNSQSVSEHSRPSLDHLDKMRAIGLKLARGVIVALLEDQVRPDKYWSSHVMEAHKDPYAAIGGAIENEVDRPLNWAIYFCDFGRYQNPLNKGLTPYLCDVNVTYKYQTLNNIKEVWQDTYHEPCVNNALMAQRERLWLSPEIVVYQHRQNLRLCTVLLERYDWGRYYAGIRVQQFTLSRRLLYLGFSPILPLLLMARKTRDVLIKRRLITVFAIALPLTILLTFFWSLGEFIGYVTACPISYRRKS